MSDAHPVLPEFEYIRPKTAAAASQFLRDHPGEARPFMGGTDVLVRLRDGVWKEKYLVDVKGLAGMSALGYDPETGLTIGAAVNMNRVSAYPAVKQHYPVLSQAIDSVASYQLRNRATIVGNICNASPAGDTIGSCILLDAILTVYGVEGLRQEALGTFFTGPGETRLKPGDIVLSIQLPPPPKGLVGRYLKLGRNKISDLSIVGVCAIGTPDPEPKSGYRFKLALASVAPIPLVVTQAEEILAAEVSEVSLKDAAQAAMAACTPIDDVRGSARYRKKMVRNLSWRALSEVWEALGGAA